MAVVLGHHLQMEVVLGHLLQMAAVCGMAVVLGHLLQMAAVFGTAVVLPCHLDLLVFPLNGPLMLGVMTKTMFQSAILMEEHVVGQMFKLLIAQFVNANRISNSKKN